MKSISIVMTYFNRPIQLALTLKSLEKSSLIQDTQIIVVDDASDGDKRALPVVTKSDLNIDLIEITKEQKKWRSSCVAYNMGFRKATGKIIIIQNAECFHIGDLLLHTVNIVTSENYLSYSCYAIDYEMAKEISILWDTDFEKVLEILEGLQQNHPELANWVGWYNHIKYRPAGFHWLSAITAKNLEELGGFDERYKYGFGYDDNDLLLRIKIKGLQTKIVSKKVGYAVHQKHPRVDRHASLKNCRGQDNRKLFFKLKAEYEEELGREFGGHYDKKGVIFLLG